MKLESYLPECILLLKPQVSVMVAVSVSDRSGRCTGSRPELETVNK